MKHVRNLNLSTHLPSTRDLAPILVRLKMLLQQLPRPRKAITCGVDFVFYLSRWESGRPLSNLVMRQIQDMEANPGSRSWNLRLVDKDVYHALWTAAVRLVDRFEAEESAVEGSALLEWTGSCMKSSVCRNCCCIM